VILVDSSKLVPVLGTRGKLPVEVVPFGMPFCQRRLADLTHLPVIPYEKDGQLFLSDNGNPILDCQVGPLDNAAALEATIRGIPGVVGTGLFLGMAHTVLIEDHDRVIVNERSR
jgi:ribose 5-phosphate isomerase A